MSVFFIIFAENFDTMKERLGYCRYYKGGVEPDPEDVTYDVYYFWHAEKFFVEYAGTEEEKHAVELFCSLGLEYLVSDELPVELLAHLFSVYNRNVQRGSYDLVPLEDVAASFPMKYLSKFLNASV